MARVDVLWCLLSSLLLALLVSEQVAAQKRARPAMADLEMLINDPANNYPESPGGSPRNYDNLVTLADTLKRLQELDKYYSHQARPRYGRSTQEEDNTVPYRVRPFVKDIITESS